MRSQIGGENQLAVRLTALDEQIVSMYGIDLLDGHQKLGEGGFPNKKVANYCHCIIKIQELKVWYRFFEFKIIIFLVQH